MESKRGVLAQRGRAIGKHRFRRASDEKNFQLADAPAASRNVACARRQHDDAPPLFAKKRPKLITFSVNDRFAVDGTIDRPLDTIKSRPFCVLGPLPLRRYNYYGLMALFSSLTRNGSKTLMTLDDERPFIVYSKNAPRELWVNFAEYSSRKKEFMSALRSRVISWKFARD